MPLDHGFCFFLLLFFFIRFRVLFFFSLHDRDAFCLFNNNHPNNLSGQGLLFSLSAWLAVAGVHNNDNNHNNNDE